jgi:hypothetical protein
MKLIDILLDSLNATILFEMAHSRSEAMSKVKNNAPQIVDHLIKYMAFDLPENRNHWIGELNALCEPLANILLKQNNKPIDSNTFLNWFDVLSYDSQYVNDSIQYWLNTEYKGANLKTIPTNEIVTNIINIVEKLANTIQQRGAFRRIHGIESLLP